MRIARKLYIFGYCDTKFTINGGEGVHQLFLNWILSQKEVWEDYNILTDKIIDKIIHAERPDFPYVAVQHSAPNGLGEIDLHKVSGGYILDFRAGKIDSDEYLAYCCEFTDNPLFDLWQEKYVAFLCSNGGNVNGQ